MIILKAHPQFASLLPSETDAGYTRGSLSGAGKHNSMNITSTRSRGRERGMRNTQRKEINIYLSIMQNKKQSSEQRNLRMEE